MEEGELTVDCRGHPIRPETVETDYEDYENLVLVGVWLAVKENGQALFNLLKWIEFPEKGESDDSKFLVHADILNLGDSFLQMLFQFKHRGAIEKAAECFSLFCSKLLQSTFYANMPDGMLDKALG